MTPANVLRDLTSGAVLFWRDLRKDVPLRITFVIAVTAFILSLLAFVASTGYFVPIP